MSHLCSPWKRQERNNGFFTFLGGKEMEHWQETAQKMKFSIKDFFSKYGQIRSAENP